MQNVTLPRCFVSDLSRKGSGLIRAGRNVQDIATLEGGKIYMLKNQLFALCYTLKHSLIKIISTPTFFGLIRPSSGSCRAWLLST